MYKSMQRVRYPPFEHSHMDPRAVPIIEVVVESTNPPPPAFRIGSDDDWMVEWRGCKADDLDLPKISCEVSREPFPFLLRTRDGWYIEPDPLHRMARRLIRPTVILLILTLLIHSMEPGLVSLGLLSESFAGSYRVGPLDYPKLLLVAFPVFMIPIVFRMIANLRDIKRQNDFIASPVEPPEISLEVEGDGVRVSRVRMPVDTIAVRGRLQVGVAVPERSKVLESLQREEGGQPSPGMSTRLPESRITSGEELGTGVGEATPMPVAHPRVLLLEPMRVHDPGEWVEIREGGTEMIFNGPANRWPGSIYSALIAVHWEVVIDAIRDDGTRIKWVSHVFIPERQGLEFITELPVRSGRIEST